MGFVVYIARPGRATVGLCFGSESEASDLPGRYEGGKCKPPQHNRKFPARCRQT